MYTCYIVWEANEEPAVAGYKVYCGTESGVYDAPGSPATVGNVTSYLFAVPTSGTEWYMAVAAYDGDGNEGPLSQEVIITSAEHAPLGTLRLSVR